MSDYRVALLASVIVASLPGCRSTPEATGSSAAAMTVALAPTEASVDVVLATEANPNDYAMSYDDVSGASRMGWAFTTNGGGSWTKCNAGGACGGLAPPPAQTNGPAGWLGAPAIVSDGAGHVFYVTLSDMDGNVTNGAEGVTVAISNDGGQTFGSAQIVNSDSGDTCNSGTQDQPYAAIDKDSLVIVWRHNGSGTFGGCLKRAHIDLSGSPPAASLNWSTFGNLSHSISNMDREGSAPGQGGLIVQARGDGKGVVTVVYSNNDQFTGCPSSGVSSIAWGSVTSYDGGASWTPHTHLVHSTTFQGCLIRGTTKIQNVLRAFGFVWSAFDGHQYVAVHDSKNTIRLFTSSTEGYLWREFCGGSTAPSWSAPNGSCATAFVTGADTSSTHFVAMPTLALTSRGGIGLMNYESEKGKSTLRVVFRGDSNPLDAVQYDWQPSVATSTSIQTAIVVPTTSSAFLLGNYVGMASAPPDECTFGPTTFLPAWVQGGTKKAQEAAVNTTTLNP